MNAVLFAPFGDPAAAHAAACANAARLRALKLGYSPTSAQQFARIARKDCGSWESPEHCALRIVLTQRATFAGNPGGAR